LAVKKRIALVAHDNKKLELIEWTNYNKTALARNKLITKGKTGKLLEEQPYDSDVKALQIRCNMEYIMSL